MSGKLSIIYPHEMKLNTVRYDQYLLDKTPKKPYFSLPNHNYMTLESKKLLLIRQIMEINDEGVIDDLEQYVEEKAQHKSDNDILQQLARPIRPHFDLEAIKREQGYQPINKEELNQLIKELDIQEPLEELLEMIGK